MRILFRSLRIRDFEFKNRIFVSPMCQYSAVDGIAQPWHLVHLGSLAAGGSALVVAEATAVCPEGRITHGCLGLWSEKHAAALKPVVEFIHSQQAFAGIQLAHAGRKASTAIPWKGGKPLGPGDGPWTTVAPSAVSFAEGWHVPHELTKEEIARTKDLFVESARLASGAGFDVIELHMAHGYLLNQFLSPLSNLRTDEYGGSRENRMRFPLEVAEAVRAAWPAGKPLFVRISATDWVHGGWEIEDSVAFCRELRARGVDLIDVSTGGNSPLQKIPVGPGYQVPFAERIRREAEMAVGAVGLITDPKQAEDILERGQADAVFLARELLRDPHWPFRAAKALGAEIEWPRQYERGK